MCNTPGVDHGDACHWTYVGYPEPVGGCARSAQ
jgi:hypothetical protein